MTLNELIGQIKSSLKKVAVAVFQLKNQQGELNELHTTNKTSLVNAINELASRPIAESGIDAQQVTQLIDTRFNALTNGASAAMDTLGEIETAINTGKDSVAAILSQISTLKTTLATQATDLAQLQTALSIEATEEIDLVALVEKTLQQGEQND